MTLELKQAKVMLYLELKNQEFLTENEVDLLYNLGCRDKDMQRMLSKGLGKI